jgi:hypothetical protein
VNPTQPVQTPVFFDQLQASNKPLVEIFSVAHLAADTFAGRSHAQSCAASVVIVQGVSKRALQL